MEAVLDALRPKYEMIKARVAEESTPERRRGVGVAIGHYNVTSGPNDHCEIAVALNPDNTVTVYDTWEDQGQGADVGTLTHAYEAFLPLGLAPNQIKLVMNDTKLCPTTGPAAGSRSHYMAGNAIQDGADKLLAAMRNPDGTYRTYEEMVAEGIPVKYIGAHDTTYCTQALDPDTGQGNPTAEYTYGAFLAEVEVETSTGKTRVLRMHCVADVGTIGNRLAVDGQAYGGMMHSIGFALSEDYSDVKKHRSLIGAGFPYIDAIPDGENFTVEYLVTKRPSGPHGSSGCAEMFQSGGHISIINAIFDAVGVRIFELPATPEKVKAGIDGLARGENVNRTERYYLGGDFYERTEEIKANPINAQ
jgi:aldehyde oxidoreductase